MVWQDNACPHDARVTQDFLRDQRFNVLPWPAYSPDLSPIKHLWDQLGRCVANRTPAPQNRQELVTALEEEWVNIPQDNIRRLVRSMRRCITACMNANVGHIPY
uniref:Tc1-like transposase DDE domain-containing protein n=1 Tax=Sphaeramia orbicularis TaxID=375764 RepID=A0A672YIL4_9TELE